MWGSHGHRRYPGELRHVDVLLQTSILAYGSVVCGGSVHNGKFQGIESALAYVQCWGLGILCHDVSWNIALVYRGLWYMTIQL